MRTRAEPQGVQQLADDQGEQDAVGHEVGDADRAGSVIDLPHETGGRSDEREDSGRGEGEVSDA